MTAQNFNDYTLSNHCSIREDLTNNTYQLVNRRSDGRESVLPKPFRTYEEAKAYAVDAYPDLGEIHNESDSPNQYSNSDDFIKELQGSFKSN